MKTLNINNEMLTDGVDYVSYLWKKYSNKVYSLNTEQIVGKILDELNLAFDDEPYLEPVALWILALLAIDDLKTYSWLYNLYQNYAKNVKINLDIQNEVIKNELLTLFCEKQPKKNMPESKSRSLINAL